MSTEIQQEGTFRGRIVDFALRKANEGHALALQIRCKIDESYLPSPEDVWEVWKGEWDYEAEGRVWLIKKDGAPNDVQISSLVEAAGWDGNFLSLINGTFAPQPIQFDVQQDEYKGVVRYRISWIRPYDASPRGGGNVDPDAARMLDAQYGAQIRAISGNVQRNAPPLSTSGGPQKPNGPSNPQGPAKPAQGPEKTGQQNGIPF